MDDLVSTEWLAAEIGAPDLSIVDCTYFLPEAGRDAAAEYRGAHIPGARFLDIEQVADRTDPSPHMLPSPENFAAAMGALGISSDDRIIVYDNSPHRTATRGWFMLRHFGARKVAILDGGFQKWTAERRAVESGGAASRDAQFRAQACAGDVIYKAELLASLPTPVLDARGPGRFIGSEPEPRPGLASGHIPGSRNVPMATLYRADGTLKDDAELREAFAGAGVDPAMPFVASCGSGVTANSLIFAAHRLGNDHVRLYDGSWSEWGADPATPKETGPAEDK